MSKAKNKPLIKSYKLEHKSNPSKVNTLFELYDVYKYEYKTNTYNYWNLFLKNKINNNKFSHLGSTKHFKTQLNSALLQSLLAQSCAILNNYLANISTKFNQIISKSLIKDKDLLVLISNVCFFKKFNIIIPQLNGYIRIYFKKNK